MKRSALLIATICLTAAVRCETYPVIGVDTVSSTFFREWYQTTDLGHYLDNANDHTIYQTETTGQWNLGDQNVFSVAGNSFRQTKYRLDGMRTDSRFQVGSTLLYAGMEHNSLALDYHDGVLSFTGDSVQQQTIRLTGNIGNLGGISPGTRELINLFHTSGEERTMDSRPVEMRNHVRGSGTVEATFAVPSNGRKYYQHAYAHYGQRMLTDLDRTGIRGMVPAEYYAAQLDGEIAGSQEPSSPSPRLHYFLAAMGRTDYGSEFLYNTNEQGALRAYQAGLFANLRTGRHGPLVVGLSYELDELRHNDLSFTRNVLDQDGEAFEPWYADGRMHSVNLSVQYDEVLLPWLRVHADGYNSLLHFRPTVTDWSNPVYMQSIADATPTPLYTIRWHSEAFSSGLLENEALLIAEKEVTEGMRLYGHIGVSLDGMVLGHGRSVVSPNWLAQVALEYQPVWWFRFGLSVSHHRMSYTWDDIRYLSADYMSGEMRYADNTLLATIGGAYHTPDKHLWMHQPSYAVIDLPIHFTMGRSHRHEIAVLSTVRKYYNQWFTGFADGLDANMTMEDGTWYMREGEKQYTVTTQPMDIMSSRAGCRTPYYLSNLVRYTYNGRKWFVQLSWQSYLMSGISALGNGVLSNNLGALSESTANPNTFVALSHGDLPYPANGRLDQDRAFIARIQVTYNPCKYFSVGFNGKFKDGQPFSNYEARTRTENGHTQVAVLPYCARGINLANNAFGKREDAFFNLELRATGRWWVRDIPMSVELMCYNIYDFGTALTEYTFDGYDHPSYDHWTIDRGMATMRDSRTSMSLCIPRGLLFTLRVGLEKDNQHAYRP